jgi:glycosyltransferase involved in cell wall biosynthesis
MAQTKSNVLLISNYKEDNQFSMQKFSELLLQTTTEPKQYNFLEKYPLPIINKWVSNKRIKKWAAYVDKYLIFPKTLKKILQTSKQSIDIAHIIDHSNAPYLKIIKRYSASKRLITCHDLIAIRSALGDFSTSPKISHTGKKLQNWILNSLPSSEYYACDSEETKQDLNRLVPQSSIHSKVIHLGTDSDSPKQSKAIFGDSELCFDLRKTNYLVHVGSAAWYKNREAVFKSFLYAKNHSFGRNVKLILVGPSPQPHELNTELSISLKKYSSDVICLENISRTTLDHLYLHAKLLLFPSFIEGFGWPPLEAAKMGCFVITTKTGAIHELLGDVGTYVDPFNQESINKAFTEVMETRSKKAVKVSLPTNQECRENYHQLYHQLLKTSR